MSNAKISIRYFDDREVRAVRIEQNARWWFSVLDIVALLTDQDDYTKTRNYWKYHKAKLKKENNQVVSAATQLKLLAPDWKKRLADMLDYSGTTKGLQQGIVTQLQSSPLPDPAAVYTRKKRSENKDCNYEKIFEQRF